MRFKNLDGWVITYNKHIDQFKAAKREYYSELHNNHNSPLVLRSSSIGTLIDVIEKTNGEKNKIEKLVS